MPAYLAPGDYAAFGLPSTTTASAVTQASNSIDFILKRPEGLVWVPDANGTPCYMAGLTPTMTFDVSGPLAPGTLVPVTISPPMATQDMVGDVLVIDRGNASAVEACRVSAVTGPGSIVLARVQFAHTAGVSADQGLLITEERALPANRSVTRASRLPIVALPSIQGRYSYGRRSDQRDGLFESINLLAAVSAFGGPPLWIDVDPTQVSISPTTGEIWVPAGLMLATYSEARMRYVAGWSAANLPYPVKTAVAQIVSNISGLASIPGSAKSIRAGDTQIVRDAATYLDADTVAMLAPFKARSFF